MTGILLHLTLPPPPAMPLPRIFRSAAPDDWLSPLITVGRDLVPLANCVPFPYVAVALAAGLALLELIQMVGKSSEELKYLAESVTTIMKSLRKEMDSHPTIEDTKFRQLCLEFETPRFRHLTRLSTDLKLMAKNWSASRFKRYLNSQDIRDRTTRFMREVNDLRANATLVAATGTRLNLESVAHSIAAVELGVSDIRRGMMEQRSSLPTNTTSDILGRELARYEEDFHPLKLGDIHLEFGTARHASFVEWDITGNEKRHTAWVDYRATVKGSVQTVRVYQGSDPLESWKGFLSFLAENSPSPHLPQLFGFCSSPRLRSLVFHGGRLLLLRSTPLTASTVIAEFCPLDEYAKRLPNAQMIVDWELNLVSDILPLRRVAGHQGAFDWAFNFALVNPKDHGKMIISHVHEPLELPTFMAESHPPFLEWFVRTGQWLIREHAVTITGKEHLLKDRLHAIGNLRRIGPCGYLTALQIFTARGCVYHGHRGVVAELPSRQIIPDHSWTAFHVSVSESFADTDQLPDLSGWPEAFFPTVVEESTPGYTHFVVPLLDESRQWRSLHDHRVRSGYFLSAEIEFGKSVPDITDSWLAQASALRSNSAFRRYDASEFVIPFRTKLELTWEMVLNAEDLERLGISSRLPRKIHVFVEIPVLAKGIVNEPKIYWSTDANRIQTELIPSAAFTIRMVWCPYISVMRWESHHYEVAEKIQEEHGFDLMTSAAAESMGLPVLDLCVDRSFNTDYGDDDSSWCRYFERDPHTMQEFLGRSQPWPSVG
ncbi:hypothetical protein B0H16DRAFT_1892548 [Mycena metata]|uniref:Uncharacterized protein n=1 Tax=Mycena metata TaxID=1033252 RepID=A0AAD7I4M0_9AGAR|nr:hypothetical protein B0H16DRAFT_1892548 [Mycena metata]